MEELCEILARYRFNHTSEVELQDGVAEVLGRHGLAFEREAALDGRDRIDFLVGATGIEIKVDGSLSLVTRQIHRYLQCERVAGIVVLTSRRKHANIPHEISKKPVRVLWVSPL